MRKLASVQRIDALDPIEGADAIEAASVLGWKVVVKKGEFRVGDLAVYLEIDSVPPDEPVFRFLWKNTEMRPNNFRIRTVKLRGQVSQGILFKWEDIWQVIAANKAFWAVNPDRVIGHCGDDLTEAIGVTKYEPPAVNGSTDIEGQFFDGVPKTDEERVQSETGQRLLAALQGKMYYITVKCDGASMTIASHDDQPKVASRNYRLANVPGSPYWQAAEPHLWIAESYPFWAVQGELVGPGIQNNRLGLMKPEFRVFGIFDREQQLYVSFVELREICDGLGLKMVPLLECGYRFSYDQDDLLGMAEGKYEGTNNECEGIVIRSQGTDPLISFKVISNRYLLKGGE